MECSICTSYDNIWSNPDVHYLLTSGDTTPLSMRICNSNLETDSLSVVNMTKLFVKAVQKKPTSGKSSSPAPVSGSHSPTGHLLHIIFYQFSVFLNS